MESSFYAPENRASPEKINSDYQTIAQNKQITELLDSLPFISAILNKERQVVYCNKVLLSELGQTRFEEVLGQRPGEFFECKNSKNNAGGCGTDKNCKYCGAVNSILESQKNKRKVTYECRIISEKENNTSLDLNVTSSPYFFDNKEYTIITIFDISDQKRRIALERIFFHDIVNKAGSLNGCFELLKDIEDPQQIKDFLEIAFIISQDLTDDILAQRNLLAAENNELAVNYRNISVRYLTSQAAKQIQNHTVAKEKFVILEPNNNDYIIETDPVLLNRILTNMLKNALEAIIPGEKVSIGFNLRNDGICIFIRNPSFINEEIKSQIFQRSFSTKGSGRGLGTYSMKLLGEKFLKGNVGFHTDEKKGTKFYINLPLKIK